MCRNKRGGCIYLTKFVRTITHMRLIHNNAQLRMVQCGVVMARSTFLKILTETPHSSAVRARYFVGSHSDLYSASVTAVMHTISFHIGPRYNGTRLYSTQTKHCTDMFRLAWFSLAYTQQSRKYWYSIRWIVKSRVTDFQGLRLFTGVSLTSMYKLLKLQQQRHSASYAFNTRD